MSARFFVQMVLGLLVFIFLLRTLRELAHAGNSVYISFGLIVAYGIWSFAYVKKSGLDLSSFGLSMQNFNTSLRGSLLLTAPVIALLFVTKWILTHIDPETYGTSIINIFKPEGGNSELLVNMLMYSIHAVIQEFVARGCIQGGLMQFISGPRAHWISIGLATLMFSSFHLMIDMKFALLTIVPGLFWGYLFYRYRNLLSVSISHILIGLIALFLLGLSG